MGVKQQMSATNPCPSKNKDYIANQGDLYSPQHANKPKPTSKEQERIENMVIGLVSIKEKVLEKLAAASVPADAFDNARHFLESVVRDFTVAAQGLTKDALLRIKTHLVPLLPSLSPNITTKMVDDAEKEAQRENYDEKEGEDEEPKSMPKSPYVSPTSSLFASLVQPLSRL